MKQKKPVVSVAVKDIEHGIRKYKGELDKHLQAVIKAAGFDYTPNIFEDGRVFLVLPENRGAFLYKTEKILSELLSLERS